MSSRHGYSKLPTVDPDSVTSSSNYGAAANPLPDPIPKKKRSKFIPKSLRPGIFYQFGDRGKALEENRSESDPEGIELLELKPRRTKQRRTRLKSGPKSPNAKMGAYTKSRTMLVEEPILPGDTVQRVALRYNCRDSEIRRVNNLYSDQDFFALKTVKIPVREHGVLSEEAARVKCRQNKVEEKGAESSGGTATSDEVRFGGAAAYYNSGEEPTTASSCDADNESENSDTLEYRDISIHSAIKWKHTNRTLLQKLDEDLQRVRDDTQKRINNAKEVRFTMDTPGVLPVYRKATSQNHWFLTYIFDWRTLVLLVVVLVVGIGAYVGIALSSISK